MRRAAGGTQRVVAALVVALGLTACSGDSPRPLVAASEDSEAVGEPIPTTTTSTSVTPARSVTNSAERQGPSVAVAPVTAAPAPARPAAEATMPVLHDSPPEPGVAPWGYAGYGGSKTATSGSTTVELTLYPRDPYAGHPTRIGAEVHFVGAVKSFRIDFGDGTGMDAFRFPTWDCGGTEPKTTSDVKHEHVYARPGRYTVTAVVTTFDCAPMGPTPGPGEPPSPLHPPLPPWLANERTTTVSMTAIARADQMPASPPPIVPADCPPQAGGC